jgi:hypothetical protein
MPPTVNAPAEAESALIDSFNSARATMADARKTITWLVAALAIVWLSGLEGGLQSALKQARSFRHINSVRQNVERTAALRYAELVADQTKANKTALLKKPEVEAEIDDAKRHLAEAQEKKDRASEKSWSDKLVSRERLLRDLNDLPEMKARVKSWEEDSAKWNQVVLEAFKRAKEQAQALARDINFELFGLKLKTPLLFTPVLWSIGLLSLLAYLISVRQRVLSFASAGFGKIADLPPQRRPALSTIIGPLPPWSARQLLPAYISSTRRELSSQEVEREPWVTAVFGSVKVRGISNVLNCLIPLAALLLQFRVAWLGIELTKYLGSNRTRALTSFALTLGLAALCWLIRDWFVFDNQNTDNAPRKPKRETWKVAWGVIGGVVFAGVVTFLWIQPFIGIKTGLFIQKRWWLLCLLCVALPAKSVFGRYVREPSTTPLPGSPIMTRRKAIVISAGLLLLAAGLFRLRRTTRNPRFRQKRNAAAKRPSPWKQGSGFYETAHSRADVDEPASMRSPGRSEPGNTAIQLAERETPSALHYVDSRDRIWRGGRIPRGEVRKVDIFERAEEQQLRYKLKIGDPAEESVADETRTSLKRYEMSTPALPLLSSGIIAGNFKALGPHVHLASSSWAFEEAAVAQLRKKPLTRHRTEKACKLLVFSLNHDTLFNRTPSYRLYDLLAGVSFRFQQEEYFRELMRIIRETDRKGFFNTRIAKWNDPDGAWQRRWREHKRPVKWISSSGGVVF